MLLSIPGHLNSKLMIYSYLFFFFSNLEVQNLWISNVTFLFVLKTFHIPLVICFFAILSSVVCSMSIFQSTYHLSNSIFFKGSVLALLANAYAMVA